MKIKKFNESKSRQLEWLDGDIFTLRELVGNFVKQGGKELFYFENGAICLDWQSLEMSDGKFIKRNNFKILDDNYKLFHVDNKAYIQPSQGYHVFLMMNQQFVNSEEGQKYTNISAPHFFGVFDEAGKLIFFTNLENFYRQQFAFIGDIYYLANVSGVRFFNVRTNNYGYLGYWRGDDLIKNVCD